MCEISETGMMESDGMCMSMGRYYVDEDAEAQTSAKKIPSLLDN
jgi:hypothetical protein